MRKSVSGGAIHSGDAPNKEASIVVPLREHPPARRYFLPVAISPPCRPRYRPCSISTGEVRSRELNQAQIPRLPRLILCPGISRNTCRISPLFPRRKKKSPPVNANVCPSPERPPSGITTPRGLQTPVSAFPAHHAMPLSTRKCRTGTISTTAARRQDKAIMGPRPAGRARPATSRFADGEKRRVDPRSQHDRRNAEDRRSGRGAVFGFRYRPC